MDGVEVQSIYRVIKEYKNGNLEEIIIPDKFCTDVNVLELKKTGIPEELIYVFRWEYFDKGKEPVTCVNDFCILSWMNIMISDTCNLKCKRCGSFSSLGKRECIYDCNQFKKDIRRVRELLDYVGDIFILGGEPFVNPNWDVYLKETRMTFPYADIRVFTNGILLPTLSEEQWKVFKENDIGINITAYPNLLEKTDDYVQLVKAHGIRFWIQGPRLSFAPVFHKHTGMPFNNTRDCPTKTLLNGKMAIRDMAFNTKMFNEKFGTDFPYETGQIDIYQEDLTGKKLIELLNQPFEICNHCEQYNIYTSHLSKRYLFDDRYDWALYDDATETVEDYYFQYDKV